MPNLHDLFALGARHASTEGGGAEFGNYVVVAGQAVLYGIQLYNNSASAKYLMVFDAAELPANGALPITGAPLRKLLGIPADQSLSIAITVAGEGYRYGIVAAISTTPTSLTIDTSSLTFIDVEYQPIP